MNNHTEGHLKYKREQFLPKEALELISKVEKEFPYLLENNIHLEFYFEQTVEQMPSNKPWEIVKGINIAFTIYPTFAANLTYL